MNRFSEKDWKIFRSKIAGWQEAYMDKLNKEYMEILGGNGTPSEKFWKLEKRIKEDKKDCGVQCDMRRSNQFYNPLLSNGTCRFMVFDFDNHDKGAEEKDYANVDESDREKPWDRIRHFNKKDIDGKLHIALSNGLYIDNTSK